MGNMVHQSCNYLLVGDSHQPRRICCPFPTKYVRCAPTHGDTYPANYPYIHQKWHVIFSIFIHNCVRWNDFKILCVLFLSLINDIVHSHVCMRFFFYPCLFYLRWDLVALRKCPTPKGCIHWWINQWIYAHFQSPLNGSDHNHMQNESGLT